MAAVDLAAEAAFRNARTVSWLVPLKTKNPLNTRQHWRAVHARSVEEKELTILAAPEHVRVTLPCVVVLRRMSLRDMDSHDGLRAALKHIADGVAEWVGVDDREGDGIRFQYEQERCKRGGEGVLVTVIQGARIVESLEIVDGVGGGA